MNGKNLKKLLKNNGLSTGVQKVLRVHVFFASVCWIALVLSGLIPSSASGVSWTGGQSGVGNANRDGVVWEALNGDGFQISTNHGPYTGGNELVITNGALGSGSDITNVTICGVQATILEQGVNWVRIRLASGGSGTGDIIIQSTSGGQTVIVNAYTYNPIGIIGTPTLTGWEEVAGLPAARSSLAAATLGSSLYAIGGWDGSNFRTNVYRYNGTNWIEVKGLPAGRDGLAAATLGNNIYAIGGGGADSICTNVYRYDGTNWMEVKGLPARRHALAATTLGNHLYVTGGWDDGVIRTNVYRYDGVNWVEVRGMPRGRAYLAAATLGNHLYAIGGWNGFDIRGDVYRYDGTNWTEVSSLPAVRDSLAAATLGDYLYTVGGEDIVNVRARKNVCRYDGTNWLEGVDLPAARAYLAAVTLGNHLYVMGGWDDGIIRTNVYRSLVTAIGGVTPNNGSWSGGTTVMINGVNLGDGTDITNVTLCGIPVQSIQSQSATQVVVVTGPSPVLGLGDVRVYSVSYGETVKSNAFRYTINLALASRGSTITGDNGANWDKLIDGVTTGYTGTTGFGYTYWKDAVNAPGSMTLDLKGLCEISSLRLLLYDLDNRFYEYYIEASSDNKTWTTIVDRTIGTWRDWQDIPFNPPIQVRYLRLTGTYNSSLNGNNNGFHVVEWEVYGTPSAPIIVTSTDAVTVAEGATTTFGVKLDIAPLNSTTVTVSRVGGDPDIAVQSGGSLVFNASNWNTNQIVTLEAAEDSDILNSSTIIQCGAPGLTNKTVMAREQDNDVINLALASHGSTITGNNGANWSKLIDGITTGYTGTTGFGYTLWINAIYAPGSMTLDLKSLCLISSMRLLLWDLDSRYYQYKIEASTNNILWTTLVDRRSGTWQSWQDIAFNTTITARYLRLTGTYSSIPGNNGFHVVEWEVYGTLSAPPTTYTITPAAGANGSILPGTPVTLGAGQSTSFVVSAATTNFYIASLTTNGMEVRGVAGLYTYTSWWNNVWADGAITAAFASVASDTATNGIPVPCLRQYYTNEADLQALKTRANEDTDDDGMLTWKEYWSRTNPTDSNQFLRFTAIQGALDSTGSVVRWTSETGVIYRLTSSTNLLTDRFSTVVATNIPATPPINVATDETAVGEAVLYYRIGVQR